MRKGEEGGGGLGGGRSDRTGSGKGLGGGGGEEPIYALNYDHHSCEK